MIRLPKSCRSIRAALLFAALLASCGDPEPVVMMPVETVIASLVDSESVRTVLVENEGQPVRSGTFAPSPAFRQNTSPLPGLLLTPPARVKLKLGDLPPGARLRYAIGFDRGAYEGEDVGSVRFRLGSGTTREWHLDVKLRYGEQVQPKGKTWRANVLPLDGITALILETERVVGTGAPPAVFAQLQVVTSLERPREKASRKKPNLVVIVLDTLRYDRLSCYGGREGLTPTLDALADRGALFESAYATSSWTWPSTASILTSLTTAEHGLESHYACYLSHSLLTVAEAFQAAGWTTGAISANPLVHSNRAFDQGFETFRNLEWLTADKVVTETLDWLEQNGDWRFFLYLQFTDPHEYKPAQEFLDRWAGEPPQDYNRDEWRVLMVEKLQGNRENDERLRRCTAYMSTVYDASLAHFDHELARMIAGLEEMGQLDNTVFVFTSDHGEEFLEHGNLYHGNHLHRESVGVPLILAGPGVPEGVRVTDRVENRFLPPTLLELVGLARMENLQGPDLLDAAQVADSAREPMFLSTRRGVWLRGDEPALGPLVMHGVQLGDDLFIWVPENPGGDAPLRALFDLASDPEAQRDLSAEKPERCDRYEQMITRWLERSEKVRPEVLDGGESALELLQKIGYVGK